MIFRKSVAAIASLLTAAAFAPASAIDNSKVTIANLTEPYNDVEPSPDQEWWQQKLDKAARDIRRLLIVDNGKLVLEYNRDNVEEKEVYEMWSVTKVWTVMLMGMVVYDDDYDVGYNTTLGEIFENNTDAWSMVTNETELEFKKGITVYEMMSFTSGLSTGVQDLDSCPGTEGQLKDTIGRVGFFDNRQISNVVGVNISESLYIPAIHPDHKGEWRYLTSSNVMSYMLLEVTGKDIKDLMLEWVFPSLGLGAEDIDWDPNEDGVSCAFSGLRLTGRSFAKLTQLMLQGGMSDSETQLVPREYVDAAFSDQILTKESAECGPIDPPVWRGYLWEFHAGSPEENLPEYWWWGGFMGQRMHLDFNNGRIVVVQRSNTAWEGLLLGRDSVTEGSTNKFARMASSLNYTFEVPEGFVPSAASTSVLSVPAVAVTVLMIAFGLY